MYHVTDSNHIEDIRENGLVSRGVPGYYSPRYEIDMAADRIGRRMYSRWVSRVNAVYFWETEAQARRETDDVGGHLDTIVEVSPSDVTSPVWKLPSQDWEAVYKRADRPHNIDETDDLWDEIKSVVQQAQRNDGARSGTHELWTKGPIPPSAITDIRSFK